VKPGPSARATYGENFSESDGGCTDGGIPRRRIPRIGSPMML
jgi:hypothetical protein